MKGWLVVNSFLNSQKFNELYSSLIKSAKLEGIELAMVKAPEVNREIHSPDFNKNAPDFVLFWDKDIYLASVLQARKMPVFNSVRAIKICDNKILTTLALEGKVRIPKTIIAPITFEEVGYTDLEFAKSAAEILKYPLVVKEAYGSFGKQVYLAHNFEELKKIISQIGYREFLMQEFISTSYGRDTRVNVVGGKVVSAIERYSTTDFRSNISNGGKMRSCTPTKAQKELAIAATKAIGLDFAGVDILFGEGGEPILCEVNSNPHFKSTFDCTGKDMSRDIMHYIKTKMEKRLKRKKGSA